MKPKPFKLSKDQLKQWAQLTDAGRLARVAKYGERADKHRVDKSGGIELNKEDEAHARAIAYALLYARERISVHKAIAATGADWLTVTTLANHNQEFHDAWMAMYKAQDARIRGQARSLVDATMDGEDVSNAQGRMASWALERLDEDYRTQPAQSAAASQPAQLGGGIVINLIANACDKAGTNSQAIDAELVPAKEIGHNA